MAMSMNYQNSIMAYYYVVVDASASDGGGGGDDYYNVAVVNNQHHFQYSAHLHTQTQFNTNSKVTI